MAKLSTNDEISDAIGQLHSERDRKTGEFLYFAPVATEEIAFALSLFVAAAQGQFSISALQQLSPSDPDEEECRRVFAAFSVAERPRHSETRCTPETKDFRKERTLEATFWALWQHYRTDERRTYICARVLNFYHLMERTRGAIVQDWVEPTPGSTESVLLHPAVIEAIASVPLETGNLLNEDSFRQLVCLQISQS